MRNLMAWFITFLSLCGATVAVWLWTKDERVTVWVGVGGSAALGIWGDWGFINICRGMGRQIKGDLDKLNKEARELKETANTAMKGREYGGIAFSVWVDDEDGKQAEISWEWKGIGLLGELMSTARIVGFRKDGGGFTAEALQEEGNGVCIVDSRQKGSKVERDLAAGHEYFYTFFVKESGQDEGGKLESRFCDPVRFSVRGPNEEGARETNPTRSKDETAQAKAAEMAGEFRREVLAGVGKFYVAEGLKKAVQESKEYQSATAEAKQRVDEYLEGKFEEWRMQDEK